MLHHSDIPAIPAYVAVGRHSFCPGIVWEEDGLPQMQWVEGQYGGLWLQLFLHHPVIPGSEAYAAVGRHTSKPGGFATLNKFMLWMFNGVDMLQAWNGLDPSTILNALLGSCVISVLSHMMSDNLRFMIVSIPAWVKDPACPLWVKKYRSPFLRALNCSAIILLKVEPISPAPPPV